MKLRILLSFGALQRIERTLNTLLRKVETSMYTGDQILALVQKVNEDTNTIALQTTAVKDVMTKARDEITALKTQIANGANNDKLQTQLDAVGDTIAQAEARLAVATNGLVAMAADPTTLLPPPSNPPVPATAG